MAIWNPTRAMFYLNAEPDHIEAIKGRLWTVQAISGYIPGKVGVATWHSGNSTTTTINQVNTGYPYPAPSSVTRSMTTVMWASGLKPRTGLYSWNKGFGAGWGNGQWDLVVQNGIIFGNGNSAGSASGFTMCAASRHGASVWPVQFMYPDRGGQEGWAMYAGHVEWTGANHSGWYSINAGPWQYMGVATNLSLPDNSWGGATIVRATPGTSQLAEIAYDEVGFWTDGDRPEQSVLTTMYQMGMAGVPLNQYSVSGIPNIGNLNFYLPSESFREEYKGQVWVGTNCSGMAPGIIASGIVTSGLSNNMLVASTNTAWEYIRPTTVQSGLTFTAWSSGMNNIAGRSVRATWASTTSSLAPANGIYIGPPSGAAGSGTQVIIYSSGLAYSCPINYTYARTEPCLTAVHLSLGSGGYYDARFSINGQPWVLAGTGLFSTDRKFSDNNSQCIQYGFNQGTADARARLLDEGAMWIDAPMLSSAQLAKTYLMGQQSIPLSQFGSFGVAVLTSGSMPLSLTGFDIIIYSGSGSAPAFTKGKAVASGSSPLYIRNGDYLCPDQIVFHHPLDNQVEAVHQRTWSKSTDVVFSRAVVNSGIFSSSYDTTYLTYPNLDNAYPAPQSTQENWTAMVWASGLTGASHRYTTLAMGWGGVGTNDGVGFVTSANGQSVSLQVSVNHGGFNFNPLAVPNEVIFLIGRVEFSGGMVFGYLSYDGGDWIPVGSGVQSKSTGVWGKGVMVGMRPNIGSDSTHFFDEAVLWKDAPRFSAQQLYSLYANGLEGRDAGNFQMYSKGARAQAPLFIAERFTVSGTAPCFVEGPHSPPHSSDVLYYEQCDDPDQIEYKQSVVWDQSDRLVFAPFAIVGGVGVLDVADDASFTYPRDPSYSGVLPSQVQNFTTMVWSSGLPANADFFQGWLQGPEDMLHGIDLCVTGLSGLQVRVVTDGQRDAYPTYIGLNFDPMLIITRIERTSGNLDGYVSIDGNPWHYLGTLPDPGWTDINATHVGAFLAAGTGPSGSIPLYVDELTLWTNNARLTNTELAKIYALANVYHKPLNQYTETYIVTSGGVPCAQSAPLFLQCSEVLSSDTSLFTAGWAWIPFSSGTTLSMGGKDSCLGNTTLFTHGSASLNAQTTLYISGIIPILVSGTTTLAMSGASANGVFEDYTLETLLRTEDHNPQVLGKLDVIPSSQVKIELWTMVGGKLTTIVPTNDLCYAIGNTGRWGWSTQRLPVPWPNSRPQYFYRMKALDGTTFEGQFIMTKPRPKAGRPLSRDEYIFKF